MSHDSVPHCPDWLTGEARECWFRTVPLLDAMGVLHRVDGSALSRYCVLFQRYVEAERYIAEHGMTRCGQEVPHVGRASKLADALLRIEARFGMTPASRAALAVGR